MKIVHFLRGRRRAVTAKIIAEEFEICTRTVYRDIQDLMNSGVPIRGETGVGYVIDKKYYLPPVTFDVEELEAIGLGFSMVRQWTDEKFAEKALSAFDKIQAVLPTELQGELQQITAYSRSTQTALPWTISFSDLRECIRTHRKIHIVYNDEVEQSTLRTIHPLALIFFSPGWLVASWCEKRNDFRNFRLDRIKMMELSDDIFEDDADKNLAAYKIKSATF
jgi:predicted DNA-binding transcriptional regulator YafY